MTPKVSVLMPVFRPNIQHAEAAIESIITQTFAQLELVIVEDPSEISLKSMIRNFSDSRIKLFSNSKRTSLLEQRNRSIHEAQGHFIAQLDADDIAMPERLDKQISYLEQFPQVDILGSHLEIIDTNGKTIGYRYYPETHKEIYNAMAVFNPVANSSVFAKKSQFKNVNGYTRHGMAEDYDLYSRLALNGSTFENFPEALVKYRIDTNATKHTKLREHLKSTIAIKQSYWKENRTTKACLRILGERILLFLPPRVVYKLFLYLTYSTERIEKAFR